MTKTTVIHHNADFDGIFCREIARKFLPDAELIGWDYGNPLIPMPNEGLVYILDLSPDCLCDHAGLTGTIWSRIVWIDHHKSAIDKYGATGLHDFISGYRIDGVAACRLAWQWFKVNTQDDHTLPTKNDFINRIVQEPYAVRLAGEYDIWDKRDPDAELFQHGLRSREITDYDWKSLLSLTTKATIEEIEGLIAIGHRDILNPDGTNKNPTVLGLLEGGRVLQYARTKESESIIKNAGFTFQWEGLTFLGCNAARFNSHLFTAGLKPEHDACFGFAYRDGQWTVSLYHAPGKEYHDLSLIAVKYGGGGHRGACGFRAKTLPFLA